MQYAMMLLLFILSVLVLLSYAMKPNKNKNVKEKISPFECGFDPSHNLRSPFSLRFFMMTVIFLIFDIEVAVLLPLPLNQTNFSYSLMSMWNMSLFMLLTLGFFFEWKQGALNWTWTCI